MKTSCGNNNIRELLAFHRDARAHSLQAHRDIPLYDPVRIIFR
jgi:hypothetical protein